MKLIKQSNFWAAIRRYFIDVKKNMKGKDDGEYNRINNKIFERIIKDR